MQKEVWQAASRRFWALLLVIGVQRAATAVIGENENESEAIDQRLAATVKRLHQAAGKVEAVCGRGIGVTCWKIVGPLRG